MDIQALKSFFMWCTIINGGLLILSAILFMLFQEVLYRIQTQYFPMSRETFCVVFYSFIGVFKIFFLFFNAVPYFALQNMG